MAGQAAILGGESPRCLFWHVSPANTIKMHPLPAPRAQPSLCLSGGSWLPDTCDVWIDHVVNHETVLMMASRFGRVQCLVALIREFGAGVNVQVSSLYI
jgi:hypothetical protein